MRLLFYGGNVCMEKILRWLGIKRLVVDEVKRGKVVKRHVIVEEKKKRK